MSRNTVSYIIALGIILNCTSCSPKLSFPKVADHKALYNQITAAILDKVSTNRCFNEDFIDKSAIHIDYVLFDTLSFIHPDIPIYYNHKLIDMNTGELNDTTGRVEFSLESDAYPKYRYGDIFYQYLDATSYIEKENGIPVLSHSPIYQQDSSLVIISTFSGVEYNFGSNIESKFTICSDGSYVLKSLYGLCVEFPRDYFKECK